MPRVIFTANLRPHTDAAPCDVAASTVGEALAAVFAQRPALRGYVLDDQGAVRKHVTVFVNGEPLRDRQTLTDPLTPDAEIYVAHALSGG